MSNQETEISIDQAWKSHDIFWGDDSVFVRWLRTVGENIDWLERERSEETGLQITELDRKIAQLVSAKQKEMLAENDPEVILDIDADIDYELRETV